jgi:hypothetical protein
MGYESRIYVIRKTDVRAGQDEKFNYAEVMAVYNMGRFPPFQKLFDGDCLSTKHAFYGEDGNTEITEDTYGDFLRERPLAEVINCLERVVDSDDMDIARYARIKPLLAALREFGEIQDEWYRLAVVHYGY